MSVEIIRVEDQKPQGWGDRAWEQAKDKSYWVALPAAPLAVVAAPFIATTVATVGLATLVTGAALTGVELWRDSGDKPPPVTIYTPDQALELSDANGAPLMRGTTYLRHPKRSEREVVIRSADFHSFIMSQKVAEIIDYMRSELRLKSLNILIRSYDSKNAVVGGQLQALAAEAKAAERKESQRYVDLRYSSPERQQHRESYVWINDFPEVIAATRNAKRGTMTFTQSTDMSFGLSASAASVANCQVGWLSTFVMEIEATFA